jgi:hypothetical protein
VNIRSKLTLLKHRKYIKSSTGKLVSTKIETG